MSDCERQAINVVNSHTERMIEDLKQVIRSAERDAIERCAKLCDDKAEYSRGKKVGRDEFAAKAMEELALIFEATGKQIRALKE